MQATARIVCALCLSVAAWPVLAADDEQQEQEQEQEAAPPGNPETAGLDCGDRELAACTRSRIAALEHLTREFHSQARERMSTLGDPFATPDLEVQQLNDWLVYWRDEADKLAKAGRQAVDAEEGQGNPWLMRSFNLRYLSFREQMRSDSQRFFYRGNDAKRKHRAIRSEVARLP